MERRRFTFLGVTSSDNISLLALCNYDAPITSQVSSNVVNY